MSAYELPSLGSYMNQKSNTKAPYCFTHKEYFPEEFKFCPLCGKELANHLPKELHCYVIKYGYLNEDDTYVEEKLLSMSPFKSWDFSKIATHHQINYCGEYKTTDLAEIKTLILKTKWRKSY